MIHLLGNVGLVAGAAAALLFCVAYHLSARWWTSPEGRHLMSFTGTLAAVLSYSTWRTLTSPPLPLPASVEVVRALIFCAVAGLLVWRCWMLGRAQIWASWRREKGRRR